MNINLTLIAQMVSFVFFVWFTMRFIWPPIIKALDERKQKIADGLAAAERGQHEKHAAEQKAREVLHEAHTKAQDVIAHAQKRADGLVEDAKNTARAEGERQLVAARAQIDQEAQQAREALRAQVASLVLTGAERVLAREVDANAHAQLLNELAAQL